MHDHPSKSDLFKGRHFGQESFMSCIRWYLPYKLSDRDLVEVAPTEAGAIQNVNFRSFVTPNRRNSMPAGYYVRY